MHTHMSLWFRFHVGGHASEDWEQTPFFTYRARTENRNSTKYLWNSVKPIAPDSVSLLLCPNPSPGRLRDALWRFAQWGWFTRASRCFFNFQERNLCPAHSKVLGLQLSGQRLHDCPFPRIAVPTSCIWVGKWNQGVRYLPSKFLSLKSFSCGEENLF